MLCASPRVAGGESRSVPPWIRPLASFAHTKLKRVYYEIDAYRDRCGRLCTRSPGILQSFLTGRSCRRCHLHLEHRDVWQLERQCQLDERAGVGGFPNNGNGGVATYDAMISAVGSPYTVTLNTNVTVEDLLLSSANATLNQTSGTFTATGAITLSAGTFQLNGGTISNTTVNVTGGTLAIAANSANLLTGVTVNGDSDAEHDQRGRRSPEARRSTTAHLAGNVQTDLGFAPGQTLTGTILFEGGRSGTRGRGDERHRRHAHHRPDRRDPHRDGLRRRRADRGRNHFGGAMTLTNNGLISSQVSGRTITVNPASLTNSGTGILEATGGGILTINATNWSNVGNLRLTGSTANLSGTWSNLGGTITADATSTLNFGGSFATPNLGTLSLAAGSQVNVTGAWNNSGQTFTFNKATGSWTLNGGTISGGTLGFADGKTLVIAANGSNYLDGRDGQWRSDARRLDGTNQDRWRHDVHTAHLAGGSSSRSGLRARPDAHRHDPVRRRWRRLASGVR